jgi:hypothetical protein
MGKRGSSGPPAKGSGIKQSNGSGTGGPNRRSVTPRPDGQWSVQRPGSARPSAVERTQQEAIDRARELLQNDGGGELTIHGRDGRIRDSDTVAPGGDPSPPTDKK